MLSSCLGERGLVTEHVACQHEPREHAVVDFTTVSEQSAELAPSVGLRQLDRNNNAARLVALEKWLPQRLARVMETL